MTGFDGKRVTAVDELCGRIDHIVHQRDTYLQRAAEARECADADEERAADLDVTRLEYCAILAQAT